MMPAIGALPVETNIWLPFPVLAPFTLAICEELPIVALTIISFVREVASDAPGGRITMAPLASMMVTNAVESGTTVEPEVDSVGSVLSVDGIVQPDGNVQPEGNV